MRLLSTAIVAFALLVGCSQQPDAKDLVWPSDEEVFGIEPGDTIRATLSCCQISACEPELTVECV